MEFDWYEYAGLISVLFISVAFIFWAKKQKNGESSVLTNQVKLTPIVISLIASNTSGMSLLAKPAESYKYGLSFFIANCIFSFLIFVLTHSLFATVLYRLEDDSIYEYFEKRFSRSVKKLAVIAFIISKICGMAIIALPPAVVINQFSGLPVSFILFALLSVTTLYTALGGYLGVIWTDAFQGVIMLVTMVVLTLISLARVGGPSRVWSLAKSSNRLDFPELTFDPTARLSVWTYFIAVSGLSVTTLNQSMFQRYKSLSKKRDMVRSLWLQYAGFAFFQFCAAVIGLSVYAYYDGCDPKSAKIVNSYENVIVYWVNDVGKIVKGLRGIYVAGITCASISTISTHVNSCAGLICKEGVTLFMKIEGPDRFNFWLQLSVVLVGVLATGLALSLSGTRSLLELSYCLSAVEGIVSGFFVLGVLFVRANTKGALLGGFISLLLTLSIMAGSEMYRSKGLIASEPTNRLRTDLCPFNITTKNPPEISESVFYLFRISSFLMTPFASLTTIILGYLISLSTRRVEKRNPDLYSPFVRKFLRFPRKNTDLVQCAEPILPRDH